MDRRQALKRLGALTGGLLYSNAAWSQSQAAGSSVAQAGMVVPIRALVRRKGELMQPLLITPGSATPGSATQGEVVTKIDGVEVDRRTLSGQPAPFEVYIEPSQQTRSILVSVEANQIARTETVTVKAPRKVLVYVLPHSHHDLGYTDLQAAVEEKQMQNITLAMELADKTASYPEGARFIWNLEVLWGCDFFMQRRSEAEKKALIEAIRKGHISPQGSYANELTGLCRPEELLRLFKYGTQLAKECGIKVDSAMMSDVPGYSWGTVTAMSQAGIRYFSGAPNFFDRIGSFMEVWQDRPFWWVSPSGREKILMWVPWTGYALSHITKKLDEEWVGKYQDRLDTAAFPYDISYIRWSGHGDNAAPDPEISDFIRDWNAKYEWPRFHIASTSTAFSAFEKSYGHQIPSYQGDLTPYWEDGAGSSALETAMSRNAAERLTQAAILASMVGPANYVESAYATAWRDVLMYSEHTWGAWCSVSDSESPFTKKQWDYKRDFAVKAESRSDALIAAALGSAGAAGPSIDIHNTSSWSRTEVVLLSRELSAAGDSVTDANGKPVPSQRLSTGELAILVTDVPALGTARYTIASKPAHAPEHPATVKGGLLANHHLRVHIDAETGDIAELYRSGSKENLVDRKRGTVNQYLFLSGTDMAHLGHSGKPTLVVEENGPLVATLRIESSAVGCKSLTRTLRLYAGADYVEIHNLVDKERAPLNPHPGKGGQGDDFAQHGSKESVQFAFPLAVPDGKMLMDIPLGAMQPEIDQLPGSCKNWLPVGRWIDVSNDSFGITWATLDAPLVEIGGITATMLGSQRIPAIWRQHIEPTQTFYSWVMNNHWGTNYLAYQSGPVTFRYALRPHDAGDIAEASRFATGLSQPLVPAAASSEPASASMLTIEPASVLLTELKPSDDGKAWIVRLFGASEDAASAHLTWNAKNIGQTFLSNLTEEPLKPVSGDIPIAGWDLITLRVERT
ncbi:MAG TPA: glycoside hydrolase family 38 C-terminal domain-containing protein [Acidobacteriaceae bacterium]|nr:glycoside hydrolase family 38 C-terminal domain-containing protein [Acidobacteriaceae bacterium]